MRLVLLGLIAAICAVQSVVPARAASRHNVALPLPLVVQMTQKNMAAGSPVLIRTYKLENELEIWKRTANGRYALLKTYPICRWSGQLGPKYREGDGQAPEGFYSITAAQMNPNSSYHLSFNTGFPNAYDRALNRTGSFLMVHGDCLSIGCYAMSNAQIEEIYALVREAHDGGQIAVPMQALPFRFSAENMAHHRLDPEMEFWKNLKEGADRFDISGQPPKTGLCRGRYVFDRQSLPGETETCGKDMAEDLTRRVAARTASDEMKVNRLVRNGEPAINLRFAYGGQHPSFAERVDSSKRLPDGPIIRLVNPGTGNFDIEVAADGYGKPAIRAAIITARVFAANAVLAEWVSGLTRRSQ